MAVRRAPPPRPSRLPDEWTPERAESIAERLGIRLGADHWRVIACARELRVMTRLPLDVSVLAARVEMEVDRIHALFPGPVPETLRALAGLEE